MSASPQKTLLDTALTQQILQSIGGIRYGSVEIIVHDGRIVQIERREKLRLEPTGHVAAKQEHTTK